MKTSNMFLPTLRELPADAEIVSHQLMLRASMIRKVGSGIYSWLPLGLRVLNKISNIVREEMDKAGALEMLMPAIHPAELWQESGRWEAYGELLLKIKDSQNRAYCFGPTHEEVITDIVRGELRSYKQLPVNFYQIQTKFRDEIRPRFGVMRAREFTMKDAYSFHIDKTCLQKTYDKMYETYSNIFTRTGLQFRAVFADTGSIGGNASHEFQVLAETGEDIIAYSDESDYAANVELAEALLPDTIPATPSAAMETIATPNVKTIDDLCAFMSIKPEQTLKTLLVKGSNDPIVALVLRGDHQLNVIKAEKLPEIFEPFEFADNALVAKTIGCEVGSIGPVGLDVPVIIDRSASVLDHFVCGANKDDQHLKNVCWERDVVLTQIADIRNVVEGDPSPDGKGKLKLTKGVEVGHIFQLGDKYSQAMQAGVLDENGKNVIMQMGCYGIGISRIVAAAIEQNNDENGIIWPDAIAPYQVAIVPINQHKSVRLRQACEALYAELTSAGFEVLYDDRKERPGVLFADMDLIGIPHRLVMSDRGLDNDSIEYKHRRDSKTQEINRADVISHLHASKDL